MSGNAGVSNRQHHAVPLETTVFFRPTWGDIPDYRATHPQVALYDAPLVQGDGTRDVVYVDLLMADPLLRMWRAGISTTWSCQGGRASDDNSVGYCAIADASRTYEAMQIIGAGLGVDTFELDSLSRDVRHLPHGEEVIRWRLGAGVLKGGTR